MPDKYYLIISIAFIALIGVWSIFNAGYEKTPPVKNEDNEVIFKSLETYIKAPEEKETDKLKNDSKGESNKVEKDENQESQKGIYNNEFFKEAKNHPNQAVKCLYQTGKVLSPKAAEINKKREEVWVTSLMNKKYGVAIFNLNTGEKIKEIKLPDGGGVEIIFNNDESLAFVSQMETGNVFAIDSESKEIVETYNTESRWTKALTLKGNNLYTSNWLGNDVSKINLETGEVIKYETVNTPRGIHVTEDEKFLYVAGFENGEIQKINLETKESKVLKQTEGAMRSVASDENFLYFTDMAKNKVFKLNKDTDKVTEFADTDNNPNTLRLALNGKVLIVSNRGINYSEDNYFIPGPEWGSLQFFDVETGELLDAIVAGNQPTALTVSGKKMIYSNFLDHNIVVCKIPAYEVLQEKGRTIEYKKEIKKDNY